MKGVLLTLLFVVCLLFYLHPCFKCFEGFETETNLEMPDQETHENTNELPENSNQTDSNETEQGDLEMVNHTKIDTGVSNSCPTTLIEQDGKFYLYNNKIPYKQNKNPLIFDHLEEYSKYIHKENKKGNKCPILFLQQSYNVQGMKEYKVLSDPVTLKGKSKEIPNEKKMYSNMFQGTQLLVDSNMNDPPYNKNSYPGFDAHNQSVGEKTPLDLMNTIQQSKTMSPNPDDPNWGGNEYTQQLIRNGYYDNDQYKIEVQQ